MTSGDEAGLSLEYLCAAYRRRPYLLSGIVWTHETPLDRVERCIWPMGQLYNGFAGCDGDSVVRWRGTNVIETWRGGPALLSQP